LRKSKNITKINNYNKKALIIILSIALIIFSLLIVRIFFLQFIQGPDLKKQASIQQTSSRTIAADRGAIYDANGKTLAISAGVDTVSVNPSNLKYSDKTDVNKEFAAKSFSEIFQIDYEKTLEKLQTNSSYVTIASKVEVTKIDELKKWKEDNDISSGIKIESTIKRYYPYNNLASNLIGFTGTDHTGLSGLENSLDDILAGTPGKIITLTDSLESDIPNQEQTYIAPENGSNIYLTIDINIQSVTEKYLAQAVADNDADSGIAIVMDPSNGDILAMANCPNYDLNNPYTPTDTKILKIWDTLSSEEKNNMLFTMWKNICVQDTYEPGSTFKIITAATALEEGITTADIYDDFYCSGYEKVENLNIHCWRYTDPHQYQSLRQALANSCNPAFMQLGQRIGAKTLYKYYEAFGLFNKTSSDFYGESNSIFHGLENVNTLELAIMSFGQRFTITPIQLITAISAIANEGVLMEPRIIKQIEDTDTGAITINEPKKARQVLSKETSETLLGMLEYVVTDGTGKYSKVSGYSVGGKSGTSEPINSDSDEGYVASFISVSPTANPEVVVLVALFNPKGDSHQGGTLAGPVISQILSEVLPYLGVASATTDTSNSNYSTVTLPDLKNKSLQEAKSLLESDGLTVKISNSEEMTALVTSQMPKPGVSLIKNNSVVYLYTDSDNAETSITVPSFKNMSASEAISTAKSNKSNVSLDGSGIVVSQDTASGTLVEPGTIITLTLNPELTGGY